MKFTTKTKIQVITFIFCIVRFWFSHSRQTFYRNCVLLFHFLSPKYYLSKISKNTKKTLVIVQKEIFNQNFIMIQSRHHSRQWIYEPTLFQPQLKPVYLVDIHMDNEILMMNNELQKYNLPCLSFNDYFSLLQPSWGSHSINIDLDIMIM